MGKQEMGQSTESKLCHGIPGTTWAQSTTSWIPQPRRPPSHLQIYKGGGMEAEERTFLKYHRE